MSPPPRLPVPVAKLTHRIKGPGEYAGIRPATVRRWRPFRRTGLHFPTPVPVLAEWHLLRVLCRLYVSLRAHVGYRLFLYMRGCIGSLEDLVPPRVARPARRSSRTRSSRRTTPPSASSALAPCMTIPVSPLTVGFSRAPLSRCTVSLHYAAKRSTGASRFCFLLRSDRFGVSVCIASMATTTCRCQSIRRKHLFRGSKPKLEVSVSSYRGRSQQRRE